MIRNSYSTCALLSLFLIFNPYSMASSGCPNNCSAHGECTSSLTCLCEEGWSGADCSTYQCSTHVDRCSGHGQCRENGCICHASYGGYNCASLTTNCLNHCKGHGYCLDSVCTCDLGYTGEDCGLVDSSVTCPSNCSGHGFCDFSNSNQTPTCICIPDYWGGEACNIQNSRCPQSLNNCTGHGICAPQDILDPSSPWTCVCETGFCGDSCSRACPACLNNCTGKGLCVGTTCQCEAGFGGDDCSLVQQLCPNNCSGYGRCVESTENKGTFECLCDSGYGGASCVLLNADTLCPTNCSGKGECMSNGLCRCLPGFNGTACERALGTCEANNNCSANGICRDGVCKCYPGFSGSDCSQACHTGGIGEVGCNADKHHGVCINGTCLCKAGEWEGIGCEKAAHEQTIMYLVSDNNPLGLIVLSICACALILILLGYVFNYLSSGKRGLNAIPYVDQVRVAVKGQEYQERSNVSSTPIGNDRNDSLY